MRDTNDIYKIIGENIRRYRQEKGFSQEDLAFTGGINRSFCGALERAEKKPSIDTIWKIAKTLQVPLYKFFVINEEEP